MKKNFSRNKLDLNKQTIATLTSGEMRRIHGGTNPPPPPDTDPQVCSSIPIPTCPPCPDELTTLNTELTTP